MAHQNFVPGIASQDLKNDVELTISAKNLLNKDVLSKSDPMCVVYVQHLDHSWVEHGRTEQIHNTLNPEYTTKILIGYRFEELQKLKFKIYDIDSKSTVLDKHDFLGEAECSLGEIVSSRNFVTTLHHPKNKYTGQLCIKAEEIGSLKEDVELLFSAEGFKKSGILSKPDPFLAIYKESTLVHRTPFIKDNCNPEWPSFVLPMRFLRTKDEKSVPLMLQCWNWNGDGSHKLIGEVQVTTQEILSAPKTFSLSDKKTGKSVGKLSLHESKVRKTHTFLDYVSGGTQINCTIAIDFTASNGTPSMPTSLHYMGPTPNLYEQALLSVVTIIQDYDSDKHFPVLGFGAKVPPNGNLSHEFFVNLSANPHCFGVGGVIEAYRRCLPLIQLYGPTNFSPVINHVARFAAAHSNGDNYFVLLILTDGEISDFPETKQVIYFPRQFISASHLPMSIIIVGIGPANFSSMKELDSDNGRLTADGRSAVRDIVQFVSFRDFLHQADSSRASIELASALLAEVPNQLVAFMKLKKLTPKMPF
ncbi:copine-8 isoform X2 [Daphnia magna]|uniref:copine-8 isoform X2 n=1 Tax=Daphnia magna TaxID=35525 RepID=UPI001E1BBACE|nr:copine-8 isoform X2 [Daphnia magna]